jgi:hypothetical protein
MQVFLKTNVFEVSLSLQNKVHQEEKKPDDN